MSQIKCPNCGATFEVSEDKCPYCGYINPGGAEAKFLRDLEKTRKKLDEVDDEARNEYKNEMKNSGKRAAKIVITVALIILLIIGGGTVISKVIFGDRHEIPVAEEIAWEHETFAEYDELFEAQDYETLMERIADDGEDGHDVWSWEHYEEFMEIVDELWGEPVSDQE